MDNYGQNFNSQEPKWGFGGYIAVSILELLCCGVIWGILGIVFSVQANELFKQGEMHEFERKKGYARNCLIIGPILAVGYIVFKTLMV